MFFDVDSLFVKTAGEAACWPEWEEREAWIHAYAPYYDPTDVNWCDIDVLNMNRDKGLQKYYAFYTLNNLYEYYVFRSLIIHLNKLAGRGSEEKLSFTLGHYMPFKKGGVHFPSNWIIQTYRDNSWASDDIPKKKQKWSWEKQYKYIMERLPKELNQEYAARTLQLLHIVEGFY